MGEGVGCGAATTQCVCGQSTPGQSARPQTYHNVLEHVHKAAKDVHDLEGWHLGQVPHGCHRNKVTAGQAEHAQRQGHQFGHAIVCHDVTVANVELLQPLGRLGQGAEVLGGGGAGTSAAGLAMAAGTGLWECALHFFFIFLSRFLVSSFFFPQPNSHPRRTAVVEPALLPAEVELHQVCRVLHQAVQRARGQVQPRDIEAHKILALSHHGTDGGLVGSGGEMSKKKKPLRRVPHPLPSPAQQQPTSPKYIACAAPNASSLGQRVPIWAPRASDRWQPPRSSCVRLGPARSRSRRMAFGTCVECKSRTCRFSMRLCLRQEAG